MNACAASDDSRTDPSCLTRALRGLLLARLRSAPPSARLWVAYSGGRDSHVLLHLLACLPVAERPRLSAIHIDHGLQAQSPDWAAHCRRVCDSLGVPLAVQTVQAAQGCGESPEAAARDARWSAWRALLAPGDQLWLAQHQDDQAETLLLALLRGSGLHGLSAMPVERPLGAGLAVRPLLGVTGAELACYAQAQGLEWVEDPSNLNTAFDRNYLRHQVLPLLRERWPAASVTLARSAGHCAEAARLIDQIGDDGARSAAGSREGRLSIRALSALQSDQRRIVLRAWLRRLGFRPPGRARLAELDRVMRAARADASPLVRWSGCEVRRYRDDLIALAPLSPPPPAGIQCTWDGHEKLTLRHGLGQLSLPAPADSAAELTIGFRLSGIRGCLQAGGPSRTLKAIFQHTSIPGWLRGYVPLVLANGRLAAIGGVCICQGPLAALNWEHPFDAALGLRARISRANGTDARGRE